MELKLIIGVAAGCLTAIATLPQVIKTIRTKDVQQISPLMFLILLAGNILWSIYGFMLQDLPIIFTNAFSASLDVIMLVLKIRYRNKP